MTSPLIRRTKGIQYTRKGSTTKESTVRGKRYSPKDSSYFYDKVLLRLNNLPDKEKIIVLDAFGGDGNIWEEVRQRTDIGIEHVRIDMEPRKKGLYLRGDNVRYLHSMDLGLYDVIDLDSYGCPNNQLDVIFKYASDSTPTFHVFGSFNMMAISAIAHKMLYDFGYTRNMVKKSPALFYRIGNAFDIFCNFLLVNGVSTIRYRKTITNSNTYFLIKCEEGRWL